MSKRQLTKPLTNAELSTFFQQMAMILRSGISPAEGLSLMAQDSGGSSGAAILNAMERVLDDTGSLRSAMEQSGVFPDYAVRMTSIGENSGKLEDVMSSLALYYEREEEIAGAIRNSITYPLVMITMMLAVVFVLILYVLPVFNQVFVQLGSEMSGFAGAILRFGQALRSYAALWISLLAAIALAVVWLTKCQRGKAVLSSMGNTFILTRRLKEKIAVSRFAHGLSLMLSSGLDPDESLDLAASLTAHPSMIQKASACRRKLEEGADFSQALAETGIFTGMAAKMVSIGFKTGTADEVLDKAASQYQSEIDDAIGRAISMLEPTLVSILCVIVGLILLSVMLPLMSIMTGIG